MRSSQEMYEEVAERCSAYDLATTSSCSGGDCYSNGYDTTKSCLTCRHFASDEHCKLDLYDPIAKDIR